MAAAFVVLRSITPLKPDELSACPTYLGESRDPNKEDETLMQIAMIGLGRMGGNMAERLMKGGHDVVVYDRSAKSRAVTLPKAQLPYRPLAN